MMLRQVILGVAIAMLVMSPQRAEEAPSAYTQVDALVREERFEEAVLMAKLLLAEAERAFGPESLAAADAIDALQWAQWRSNTAGRDSDEAMRRMERSVRIKERILGPRHLDVAQSLHLIGHILIAREDWSGAAAITRRELSIREEHLGQDSHLLGQSVGRLALIEWRLGDFAAARRDYDEALAIFQNAGWPDPFDRGRLITNMTLLLQDMGDYETTRGLLEELVASQRERKTLGRSQGTAHYKLCRLLRLMGDYKAARPFCERCLEIWEVDPGPGSGQFAGALEALAELRIATGESASARPLIESALAIRRSGNGDSSELAACLFLYGNLLSRDGDLPAARSHLEEGLRVLERLLPADHPEFVTPLRDLGEVYWKLGDVRAGWNTAFRAAAIATKNLRTTVAGLSERDSLRFESSRKSSIDLLVSLLLSSDPATLPRQAAGVVLNEEIFSRAIVLDEMAVRHRELSATSSKEVEELQRTLVMARNRRSRLIMGGGGSMAPEEYREMVVKADKETAQAERDLAARSMDFQRRLQRERIGLAEVAAALPRGSALVAYLKYDRLVDDIKSKPIPSYVAFVLDAGTSKPTVTPLGAAAEIDMMVLRWKKEAGSNPQVNGEAASEASYREAGAALRERIWDPVAATLAVRPVVFVVPDGLLNLVNFATLPHPDGGYLIEKGPPLHYLSAERDLVRDRPAPPSQRALLALGGADFDLLPGERASAPPAAAPSVSHASYRSPAATCPDLRTLRFEPLDGSRAEILEIESLWSRMGRVLALTGENAREDAFKRNAPVFKDLHVATHGFFMEDSCRSEQGGHPADNPLLLSGLVLSGANARGALPVDTKEEDGILTVEEISTLDLTGVNWVVLSACGTGLGSVVTGEGVLGLRRAFEVAGAGTLIMSLWNVEDDATRVWMRGLYEARLAGKPAVESVRSAGLRMLESQRRSGRTTHPFYWGGFVAAGDWR